MQWRVVWLSVWLALSLGLCAKADDKNAEKPTAEKGDAAKPDGKDVPEPITPQKPKPTVENPLQKLFQQLQRPAKPPAARPKPSDVKPDDATGSEVGDHIDARAPKDRKQADLLKKATAAIAKNDWPIAVELLQALLGQDQDGVDQSAEEGWLSLRERALRLMQKLPAEPVQSFREPGMC